MAVISMRDMRIQRIIGASTVFLQEFHLRWLPPLHQLSGMILTSLVPQMKRGLSFDHQVSKATKFCKILSHSMPWLHDAWCLLSQICRSCQSMMCETHSLPHVLFHSYFMFSNQIGHLLDSMEGTKVCQLPGWCIHETFLWCPPSCQEYWICLLGHLSSAGFVE